MKNPHVPRLNRKRTGGRSQLVPEDLSADPEEVAGDPDVVQEGRSTARRSSSGAGTGEDPQRGSPGPGSGSAPAGQAGGGASFLVPDQDVVVYQLMFVPGTVQDVVKETGMDCEWCSVMLARWFSVLCDGGGV